VLNIVYRHWLGPVAGGYGTSGEKLLLALLRRGDVALRLEPLSREGWELVHPELARLTDNDVAGDMVIHCGTMGRTNQFHGIVAYTVSEGTRLPERWVCELNKARMVLVPSSWVATMFEASGVFAPVGVVPHGIEHHVDAATRPEPEPFTFLAIDKGLGEIYEGFRAAFTGDEPVRLIIKARGPIPGQWRDDPRIEVIDRMLDEQGMLSLYACASAFIHLPTGAGWALPISEAIGCGVPVIAAVHSGMREYLHESYVVPMGHYPFPHQTDATDGVQWACAVEEVARVMRDAWAVRGELRMLAINAQHFTRQITWDTAAACMVTLLQQCAAAEPDQPMIDRDNYNPLARIAARRVVPDTGYTLSPAGNGDIYLLRNPATRTRLILNAPGAIVWQLAAGEPTVGGLLQELVQSYPDAADEIPLQLTEILSKLLYRGVARLT